MYKKELIKAISMGFGLTSFGFLVIWMSFQSPIFAIIIIFLSIATTLSTIIYDRETSSMSDPE